MRSFRGAMQKGRNVLFVAAYVADDFVPQWGSELAGGEKERERDRSHLQPHPFPQEKSQQRDWLAQMNRGLPWAAVCLQGSAHLNAPSRFSCFSYCQTLFISATRITFVLSRISQFDTTSSFVSHI